jgi:hypothetical protein
MKNTTFEQAVEVVLALPPRDRQRLRSWIDTQIQSKAMPSRISLEDDLARYKKTQEWLNQNREQYMGQWVCLDGDRLIAHGTDALQVHAQGKAAGIEAPFLEHIVEDDEPFFAGWE